MPRLTEVSGGFEDPELTIIIDKLNAGSLVDIVAKIGVWVNEKLPGINPRVLCTFAGSARNEMQLATNSRISQVIVSDANESTMVRAQEKIAAMGITNVSCQCLNFPLEKVDHNLGKFDLLTCLGVSFFHLPTSTQRLATLRQFYTLMNPGGYIFIDNKTWNSRLAEDRDPVTVYDLGPEEQGERILSISYEYPKLGEQVYHLQLMRKIIQDGDDRPVYVTERRWAFVGYPVQSTTITDEMQIAGFENIEIVDKYAWPNLGDGKVAYYNMIIARKPV